MEREAHPSSDDYLGIIDIYKIQSQKCGKAEAYFAACVCLGSALEASLLTMAKCFAEDLEKSQIYQKKKKPRLERWFLNDLLKLAIDLKWIPSSVPPEELGKAIRASGISPDDALAKGDLGYFADWVRRIRNSVHPGNYWREWGAKPISKEYYTFCDIIVELVSDHLSHKAGLAVVEELDRQSKAQVKPLPD
jgi:hypothetical protein